MNELLVDSNYFVSLFKPYDDNFNKANKFEQEEKHKYNYVITNHILSEILTILSQKSSKEIACAVSKILLREDYIKIIHVSFEIEKKALEIFLNDSRKNISMVDCISLATIEYNGFKEFLTFDKTDFKKYQNKLKFKLIG